MGEDRNEAGDDSSAASDEPGKDAVDTWKEDTSKSLKKLLETLYEEGEPDALHPDSP